MQAIDKGYETSYPAVMSIGQAKRDINGIAETGSGKQLRS
jgi:hypothetical protein